MGYETFPNFMSLHFLIWKWEEYLFVGLLWELEILCVKHVEWLEEAYL